MLKLISICLAALCLTGCGEPLSGPYTFTNSTGAEICISVTQNDQTKVLKLLSGKTFTGDDYYTPEVMAVKDDTQDGKTVRDNSVYWSNRGYSYIAMPAETYTIEIYNRNSKYNGMYLIDSSGKTWRYEDCSAPMNTDPVYTGTSYTDSPSFVIKDPNNDLFYYPEVVKSYNGDVIIFELK